MPDEVHPIEQYLSQLARRLHLPAAERDQVLAEVRAHLEDRAGTLGEADVSQEDAERQAVVAFGPVGRISRELRAAHPSAWGICRWMGGILTGAGLTLALWVWNTAPVMLYSASVRAGYGAYGAPLIPMQLLSLLLNTSLGDPRVFVAYQWLGWLGWLWALPFLGLYLVLPFAWGRRAEHWWVPGLAYGLGTWLLLAVPQFILMLSLQAEFQQNVLQEDLFVLALGGWLIASALPLALVASFAGWWGREHAVAALSRAEVAGGSSPQLPIAVARSSPRARRRSWHPRVSRRFVAVGAGVCALLWVTGLVVGTGALWGVHARPISRLSALSGNAAGSTLQLPASASITGQTQTVYGNTVTIQKVLADGNTVSLQYTIEGTTGIVFGLPGAHVTMTLPNGQTAGGDGGGEIGSFAKVDGKRLVYPPCSYMFRFDLAPPDVQGVVFPGSPSQVQLQFSIPAAGVTSAHFTVKVPYYSTKTVMINQSATSYGQVVRLDKVVIAPSGVRFYYSTGHIFLQLDNWTLTVGGKTYGSGDGYYGGYLTGGESYTDFNENLVAQTGTWTVQMSVPPANGPGSWSFTFVVS